MDITIIQDGTLVYGKSFAKGAHATVDDATGSALIASFLAVPANRRIPSDAEIALMGSASVLRNASGSSTGIKDPASGRPASAGLAARIKAALASAAARNPIGKAPWIAAPAWQASTAYALPGTCVQNGGNEYQLYIAGTSASSGGPTGTADTPVTDGTCSWVYRGPAMTASATPVAPTVSWVTDKGGLTTLVRWDTAGAYFYSGGYVAPKYTSSRCNLPSAYKAPTTGNADGGSSPYVDYDQNFGTVNFWSDAPLICLNGGVSGMTNCGFVVEVDGQYLQPGSIPVASAGGNVGMLINWGFRKPRRYRVWFSPALFWQGVYTTSKDSVWADVPENSFRIVINGDSLTQGGGVTPHQGQDWPSQFAYHIGCRDIYNCAVGGTGFISNNGGAATTFAQRLPDVINWQPDVHIIAGNHNDSGYTNSAQQAAIVSYLQQFRAGCPNAWILCFGPWAEQSGPSAAMIAAEANMQAAVATFNDPLCFFLPAIGDSPTWVTGTGSTKSPTGTGNSDVMTDGSTQQGIHPTQRGIDYLALRYARSWRNFWVAR